MVEILVFALLGWLQKLDAMITIKKHLRSRDVILNEICDARWERSRVRRKRVSCSRGTTRRTGRVRRGTMRRATTTDIGRANTGVARPVGDGVDGAGGAGASSAPGGAGAAEALARASERGVETGCRRVFDASAGCRVIGTESVMTCSLEGSCGGSDWNMSSSSDARLYAETHAFVQHHIVASRQSARVWRNDQKRSVRHYSSVARVPRFWRLSR